MKEMIIDSQVVFYEEISALPGVRKTAENVKRDLELVLDAYPATYCPGDEVTSCIIYGTLGHSEILDALMAQGKVNYESICGKWEVYDFRLVDHPLPGVKQALIIAGSDKRGTIYGLYHLSELMGVSPLVNWNHVWPEKRKQIVLTVKNNRVSKEPSVKYRGFFINDEWPAFGNWAKEHFGDANAQCYERIFELLLRLKGNYLWPAMWASNFSLDGPGLLSAQLADEMGVVMSTSHHEPCMRSGEEYGMVRGAESPYGDAWDFLQNEEGITRFWREGLERNKPFENVITMGMRGENDTAIMAEATLEQNIDLIRSVLKTQNQLLKEVINEDLEQIPRQIVLFTEVEEFFYGNQNASGLIGDPELEGVTLMLSDNNQGSTRTLPSETMRNHKGGYGMYYHMDMHGGPHAFEWIGSTYLPKLWEQMTAAYEYGVQEIWVANVGDVGTQEYGLSFFLDLAYDIEKWGGRDATVTRTYTREWLQKQFGSVFAIKELEQLEQVIWDYTGLLARRKHETMNENVYHPVHFGEAQQVLEVSERILQVCEMCKGKCPAEHMGAFISLIYYPACGTANLMRMWIIRGRNQLYARQNRVEANDLAEELSRCFEKDVRLTEEYHSIDEGYFYGFGLSEHIGFTTWNCEDNKYPLRTYVYPANEPRMIVSRLEDTHYMTGYRWSDRPQLWKDALRPDVNEICFTIACGSRMPISYRIETECPWMEFSSVEGTVSKSEDVTLHIKKEMLKGREQGNFTIENIGVGKAHVTVEAENWKEDLPENTFVECDGYIAMEAAHFAEKQDVERGGFRVLAPYGRTGSAIKVFPVTEDFFEQSKRPKVTYRFLAKKGGCYRVRFYMAATTPVVYERKQYIGFSINDGRVQKVNTVKEEDKQFFLSDQWRWEAYNHIKLTEAVIECRKGLNELHFWGMSPAIVLERVVLWPKDGELPESYLGPRESYCTTECNIP
ncbi:MAG: glycosyl hydrolase 115 family protein [Lachnospiraceae bacterium]|nr:glycosyl hydrolase 115 family protein [Lachnospiraceae bacterium]